MSFAAPLFLALALDAAFGEPKSIWTKIPHPAVLMGKLIDWADGEFNTGENRKTKGAVTLGVLVVGAWITGAIISELPFGEVFEIVIAAILLAHRSLIDHVSAVAQGLRLSNASARAAVGRIVGRDTKDMDGPQISRAAIESGAENFSDGVVAPAFWFLIFGLPGLLIYKIVNTADSMIGYKTPRHEEFGWAAARFDDVLNFIPARLTALLILASKGFRNGIGTLLEDAPKHRSPNAGWPEAAMAISLNIALSGPRSYHGQLRDYPFVNESGRRDIGAKEIDASVSLLWRSWLIVLGACGILALF
ncbi:MULTISPECIES: adenosylcobinamide-phosphate synthase CbiB [Halocynthiibacter]|uniref:Cobalamin biosynthesis protein CobD n=1 Tax=Halocynthiibacter halioticoli TaxID=2986804 RepID=A0AAE3IWX9_9RHOB|nr:MULTISPECIES: adenosylcobinamide-phosphate synthase CbiB [Halocynthiibacter]MCV6823234.1 adenosylcobinamide-phosphate synthase CbiB [Halocynthiibacter halioticoli]MCW4056235.1 adenosylcobinamide-phosphate synthase CbiB [Halocynthiibacter sp. SDUM655004]